MQWVEFLLNILHTLLDVCLDQCEGACSALTDTDAFVSLWPVAAGENGNFYTLE